MNQETIEGLRRDICDIVYCLCAPEPQDEGEAEYERFEQVCADQNMFEELYGENTIDLIRSLVHDIPNKVALVAKLRGNL